eukprot:3784719-Rhodomonas_salina.1
MQRLQSEDALHWSMIPAALMRATTSMLNFPMLTVMASFFIELDLPVLSLESALEFINGTPISHDECGTST